MSTFHAKHLFLVLLFGPCVGSVLAVPVHTPTPNLFPSQAPRKATGKKATGAQPGPFRISVPLPDKGFKPGDIITSKGTHKLSPDDHVWIFLRDIFQGYYVQNPPAELLSNGKWEATNIRIGKEIRYIIAIYVNREGNETIRGWINRDRFERIEQKEIQALPGYRELARVQIKTPGS